MKYPYGNKILITGASSGLGLACAEFFANAGYTVWGVSRSSDESTRSCGEGVIHTAKMDVNNDESVKKTIGNILNEEKEIGIVLHCAGFGIAGAAEDTPIEAVKQQMETNYYGVIRVNAAIMPSMRSRKKGLIIVMSSVAGLISIPFQSHYSSTKYALEAYVEALRMESRPYGIRAVLVEPGDTKTAFTASRKMAIPENSVYKQMCEKAVGKMAKDEINGKPPVSAAKTAFKLAQRENPPIRKAVGFDYQILVVMKKFLPARLTEYILHKMYLS